MHSDLLKEYSSLEQEFILLGQKRDALREAILKDLKQQGLEKIESNYGNFTVAHRTTWKYTEAVKKIEERLKIVREKEQRKGVAEVSVNEYLLYKIHE